MIGFFPVPYPDEILYSVFARYHARSGNKYFAATAESLFGHDAARIVTELPNKLGFLVSQLQPGSSFTAGRFIDQNTLFPFYAPFLLPDRAKQLRTDMIERSPGGAIHGRLGVLTSNIEVDFLRYCPICAEEDFELYRETYWHRVHQLPGIFVCPHHSVFLENSNVKRLYHQRRDTLITARQEVEKTNPQHLDVNNRDHLVHLYLSQQGLWLLQQTDLMNCGPDFFRKRFSQKLFERNLASANGTVRVNKLETEFSQFFSKDILSSLSSKLEGKSTWLKRLVQASVHFQHPIRNLLLLHFLQISVEDFLKLPETLFPFGKPPFPCLNPVSDHYKELRIEKLSIKNMKHTDSGISATFECDCGFTYRRFRRGENNEKIFEYDSIIFFGDIFIEKFIELNNHGFTAKEIGLKLNIPKHIVQARLKKICNCPHSLNNDSLDLLKMDFDSKKDFYRSQWNIMQRRNLDLSRTELRKLNPTIGNWLYTKDMAWLNKNSPVRRVVKYKENRIDWKKRDEELSLAVKQLALELLNSPNKPIRISITSLAKRLKFAYLVDKRPECIPKTIRTLKKYAESTEEFIARRIYFAANYFIHEKKSAVYWQLIAKAHVQVPHLIQLPKVQKAINDSLIKIQNFRERGWKN